MSNSIRVRTEIYLRSVTQQRIDRVMKQDWLKTVGEKLSRSNRNRALMTDMSEHLCGDCWGAVFC